MAISIPRIQPILWSVIYSNSVNTIHRPSFFDAQRYSEVIQLRKVFFLSRCFCYSWTRKISQQCKIYDQRQNEPKLSNKITILCPITISKQFPLQLRIQIAPFKAQFYYHLVDSLFQPLNSKCTTAISIHIWSSGMCFWHKWPQKNA